MIDLLAPQGAPPRTQGLPALLFGAALLSSLLAPQTADAQSTPTAPIRLDVAAGDRAFLWPEAAPFDSAAPIQCGSSCTVFWAPGRYRLRFEFEDHQQHGLADAAVERSLRVDARGVQVRRDPVVWPRLLVAGAGLLILGGAMAMGFSLVPAPGDRQLQILAGGSIVLGVGLFTLIGGLVALGVTGVAVEPISARATARISWSAGGPMVRF